MEIKLLLQCTYAGAGPFLPSFDVHKGSNDMAIATFLIYR
jgi:hypothetical protein